MRNWLFYIALAFCLILSSTTYACYDEAEAEAEQGLRIHSEIMVIGLSCAKMPEGDRTYDEYMKFTENNAELIEEYENRIINYYADEGVTNPEEAMHSLRTLYANRIAQYAVEMSMLSFCDKFSHRLDVLEGINSDQYGEWARYAVAKTPSTEPRCAFN